MPGLQSRCHSCAHRTDLVRRPKPLANGSGFLTRGVLLGGGSGWWDPPTPLPNPTGYCTVTNELRLVSTTSRRPCSCKKTVTNLVSSHFTLDPTFGDGRPSGNLRYTRSLVGQKWRVLRAGTTKHSMLLSILSRQQSRGCADAARHWTWPSYPPTPQPASRAAPSPPTICISVNK